MRGVQPLQMPDNVHGEANERKCHCQDRNEEKARHVRMPVWRQGNSSDLWKGELQCTDWVLGYGVVVQRRGVVIAHSRLLFISSFWSVLKSACSRIKLCHAYLYLLGWGKNLFYRSATGKCGTSMRQVGSCYHLRHINYKQSFPHKPLFFSLYKTDVIGKPEHKNEIHLSWKHSTGGKLIITYHWHWRLLP